MRRLCAGAFVATGLALLCLRASAQSAFYLKDGDRVVFYGDSITDQRLYTTYIEAYCVTRFPALKVEFVHSGWGGDRVTGGGGGPIDVRLQRDVIPYKPTVVTCMLGMNDASYRSYDQGIFNTFADGYRHIVQTLKTDLPGVRLTLIQPSPFDDVTRDPTFEGGYNAVLIRYGDFVKQLAGEQGAALVDMNTPVVAMLQRANSADHTLAQKIIPDRVHPQKGGHLIMAEALLEVWHAPPTVAAVELDGGALRVLKAENAAVSHLAAAGRGMSWQERDGALPMPLDLSDPVVKLAIDSSDFVERLDQEPLKVEGLSAERYQLKIDGQDVGSFTREQLADGINLAVLPTPMEKQAEDVLAKTQLHNNIHFTRWRFVQVPLQDDHLASMPRALAGLDALELDAIRQQRAAAQPRVHTYELSPL